MGLVEGVVGEVVDLVVDVLAGLLGHAPGDTALNAPLAVAVDEGLALLLNLGLLLFGDGPAHHVGLAQGVAAQLLEDADDLLLVDDAAVGDFEDRLQHGVLVLDLVRVLLAGDEPGNGLHGAGAIEGDDSGDILDVLGLQAHAHACHARRLHLEHAGGLAVGEHLEHRRVVVGDGMDVKVGDAAAHQLHRVVQHGQVPQAQEVHF